MELRLNLIDQLARTSAKFDRNYVLSIFRFLQSCELTSEQFRIHKMSVTLLQLMSYQFVATAQINELHFFVHAQITST